VARPRAAADFGTIRARLEELRRERAQGTATKGDSSGRPGPLCNPERRRRDKCEGLPPLWVPTIFLEE